MGSIIPDCAWLRAHECRMDDALHARCTSELRRVSVTPRKARGAGNQCGTHTASKIRGFPGTIGPHYVGTTLQHPGDIASATAPGGPLITHEGVKAVEEAIAFLRATSPLPPLAISRGLSLGAKELVKDQGQTDGMGHQGRDGSYSDIRVNRYGRWQGRMAENRAYRDASDRRMVMNPI